MEPIKLSDIEIGGWFRFADPSDIPEHSRHKEGEYFKRSAAGKHGLCWCRSNRGNGTTYDTSLEVIPMIHTGQSWRDDDGTMSLAEAVEAAGCDGTTKLVDSNIYCDTDDRGCIDFYFHYEGEDSHIADHGAAVGYKELGGRWTVVKKGESDESV